MGRLSPENVERARELISLYPRPRSALIPMLHVAQEQEGWLTPESMAHVAELLDLTPAEVYGTATFYDMLFTHPVGRHLVSICTNIACLLDGAEELLAHAEASLGIRAGGSTTPDGEFTLEEVECLALCGDAPCLTVNWRFFGRVSPDAFDALVADLRAGRLADEVPPHGTLCRVRRTVGLTAGVPAEGRPDFRKDESVAPASRAPAPEEVEEEAEPAPPGEPGIATVTEEGAELLGPPGDTTPTPEGTRAESPGRPRHKRGKRR